MRNTYRILVGHCEKIAWKEHMEVDHKEIRCNSKYAGLNATYGGMR
jgi:hypothetical protein